MIDKKKIENQDEQWEAIEALESIANQCIYKGKSVAAARAMLKKMYQKEVDYTDIDNCDDEKPS